MSQGDRLCQRKEKKLDKDKIDILVPVYNGQRYLRGCVESILRQTFQDFQLILINDGSTDESGQICDEYADKNQNVTVVHKKNGGVSDARNRGLEESTSPYITFVDSDDYIDSDYLEVLYQAAQKHDADLVISCHKTAAEGKDMGCQKNGDGQVADSRLISKSEAYGQMLDGRQMITSVWGKLYRRELLKPVRYPVGEIYEDMKVIGQIIESSHRIAYTPYAGYYYVQRPDSITHEAGSPKHMALLENERQLKELIKDRYPQLEKTANRHYLWSCFFLLSMMTESPHCQKECQILKGEILKEWKFLLFGKQIPLVQRLGTVCLAPGVPFYRFIWRLCRPFLKK